MADSHTWRKERTVIAVGVSGEPVVVTTGVVLFDTGIPIAGIRVGTGPVALLNTLAGAHVRVNVETTLLDVRTIAGKDGDW